MDIVKFTPEQLRIVEQFAQQSDTSFYATRKQFDIQKCVLDIKVGKLGELAVYSLCKDTIKNLTYPDFRIYAANDKSWDYDLKGNGINFHVKSQSTQAALLYGESWVFQKSDTHIFKHWGVNDYVAFVLVDLWESTAKVEFALQVSFLHQHDLFKPLKIKKLDSKLAVYYKDLQACLGAV